MSPEQISFNSMQNNISDMSNYCTCDFMKIGTQHQNDIPETSSIRCNDLAMELNQQTSKQMSNVARVPEAEFLFPSVKVDVVRNCKSKLSFREKSHISDSNGDRKVFKIIKVPKVAFEMVSRKQLARGVQVAEESCEESKLDLVCDDFDERKNAFKNKRDDLFYKTIGRDVRKYLQEKFQKYLGENNIRTCQKNGAFFKEMKGFYTNVVSPKLFKS